MENTRSTSEEEGRSPVDRLHSSGDASGSQARSKEEVARPPTSISVLHDSKGIN